MKIGILTLPPSLNYGGILQAYALQTILSQMGHDVRVFMHTSKHRSAILMPAVYAVRLYRNLFTANKTPLFVECQFRRKQQFTAKFIHDRIRQFPLKSLRELTPSDVDAIVVGSDQIWRREFLADLWGLTDYFNFSKGWNIKRIAYAASFGVDDWEYTPSETRQFAASLKQYDAVSVREDSGVVLCAQQLNVPSAQVIDPTLLLSKANYTELFQSTDTSKSSGNLMTYVFSKSSEKDTLVRKIAEQYNLIPFDSNPDRILPPVEQWLRGFHDAEFVVTDSFHACVFAIIFRKPFVVFGNRGRGLARFASLLKLFGLEKHYLTTADDYDPTYDYAIPADIDSRIESLRAEALHYLSQALSDNG